MNVNTNFIECVLLLAETLSFSETARRLKVTQPCVSRQIKLFEEQIGRQVFIRDRHRVDLSEDGRQLLADIRPLFQDLTSRLAASSQKQRALEPIRIGSLDEIGRSIVVPILAAFRKKNPLTRFQVEFLSSAEIADKVQRGELDLGLISNEITNQTVRCFSVFKEDIVLVTRHANTMPLEKHDPIQVVTHGKSDSLFERFSRRHLNKSQRERVETIASVNSHTSMLEFLALGDYFAVMPVHAIRAQLDQGTLRIVEGKGLANVLHLIQLDSPYFERHKQDLSRFLMHRLRELSA